MSKEMNWKQVVMCVLGVYVVFMLMLVVTAPAFADTTITCRVGIVVEANEEEDILVIEDACGLTWEWEGIEDLFEGDVVVMMMSNNNTPESIFDDFILSVEYSGFVAADVR